MFFTFQSVTLHGLDAIYCCVTSLHVTYVHVCELEHSVLESDMLTITGGLETLYDVGNRLFYYTHPLCGCAVSKKAVIVGFLISHMPLLSVSKPTQKKKSYIVSKIAATFVEVH